MAQPDPDEIFETLLRHDVFAGDDDVLEVTDRFAERRRAHRRELEAGGHRGNEWADDDVDVSGMDDETLAGAMAIDDLVPDLDPEASLRAAGALETIETAAGDPVVPRGFVKIPAGEIDAFVSTHGTAIVFCYRPRDCEPCEILRDQLSYLVETGAMPGHVALAAVDGTESPRLLQERYQVGAAPTTLFCRDGRIDSRQIGAQGPEPLVGEIEVIAGESLDVDPADLPVREYDPEDVPAEVRELTEELTRELEDAFPTDLE